MKYKVMENIGQFKEGDILTQHETMSYMYCTDKICTTIFTIEKNPEKFQVIMSKEDKK